MSWAKYMASLARTGDIHALGKPTKNKCKNKTKAQKRIDSMQPDDELSKIFGLPPKPTITKTKL